MNSDTLDDAISFATVNSLDLPPESTHAAFDRVTQWIERYLENQGRFPVLPSVAPGDIARQLPASPPAEAESLETILDDFENVLLPGVTHWNHPGFFAYFATTGSAPGVLAASAFFIISSVLGSNFTEADLSSARARPATSSPPATIAEQV